MESNCKKRRKHQFSPLVQDRAWLLYKQILTISLPTAYYKTDWIYLNKPGNPATAKSWPSQATSEGFWFSRSQRP